MADPLIILPYGHGTEGFDVNRDQNVNHRAQTAEFLPTWNPFNQFAKRYAKAAFTVPPHKYETTVVN